MNFGKFLEKVANFVKWFFAERARAIGLFVFVVFFFFSSYGFFTAIGAGAAVGLMDKYMVKDFSKKEENNNGTTKF